MLIPSPSRRKRVFLIAENNLEGRIRRIGSKIFVRINVILRWMIHRQQLRLVKIDRFLERLHKSETELSIFFSKRVTLDLDRFRRPGNVALDLARASTNPVSNNPRAQH